MAQRQTCHKRPFVFHDHPVTFEQRVGGDFMRLRVALDGVFQFAAGEILCGSIDATAAGLGAEGGRKKDGNERGKKCVFHKKLKS